MAARNIERGKRRERHVARVLSRTLGLQVRRIPASGAGSGLGDLVDENGTRYEVKKASSIFPRLRDIARLDYPHRVVVHNPRVAILEPVAESRFRGEILFDSAPRLFWKTLQACARVGVVLVLAEGAHVWIVQEPYNKEEKHAR